MKTVEVNSSKGRYKIYVGRGLLAKSGPFLRKAGFSRKVFILSQEKVARHYLSRVRSSLKSAGFQTCVYLAPDGERAKTPGQLVRIYRAMVSEEIERGDALFSLGGGVIGDLGGFAASTYLRGIGFVNAGTTLLAQVDSSIGGKTGVNLPEGKNLVGTFYPPRAVISDTETLKTLPDRELRASLAEVVKYGIIRDPALFRLLEKNVGTVLKKDPAIFENLVLRCSKIKAGVVSRDEFETTGERMILNYGHTFGHAFEKVTNYSAYLHGEGVSLGMVCAARLAVRLGNIPEALEGRQKKLLSDLGLPVSASKKRISQEAIIKAMKHDKKVKGGKTRFILPEKLGQVGVYQDIPASLLKKVLLETGVKE